MKHTKHLTVNLFLNECVESEYVYVYETR